MSKNSEQEDSSKKEPSKGLPEQGKYFPDALLEQVGALMYQELKNEYDKKGLVINSSILERKDHVSFSYELGQLRSFLLDVFQHFSRVISKEEIPISPQEEVRIRAAYLSGKIQSQEDVSALYLEDLDSRKKLGEMLFDLLLEKGIISKDQRWLREQNFHVIYLPQLNEQRIAWTLVIRKRKNSYGTLTKVMDDEEEDQEIDEERYTFSSIEDHNAFTSMVTKDDAVFRRVFSWLLLDEQATYFYHTKEVMRARVESEAIAYRLTQVLANREVIQHLLDLVYDRLRDRESINLYLPEDNSVETRPMLNTPFFTFTRSGTEMSAIFHSQQVLETEENKAPILFLKLNSKTRKQKRKKPLEIMGVFTPGHWVGEHEGTDLDFFGDHWLKQVDGGALKITETLEKAFAVFTPIRVVSETQKQVLTELRRLLDTATLEELFRAFDREGGKAATVNAFPQRPRIVPN